MLYHVLRVEKGANLASADLSAGARNYPKAAGMTDGQIDQLTAYLCAWRRAHVSYVKKGSKMSEN